MDEYINAHIDAVAGGDMSDSKSGSMFDGWGDALKDVGTFWAKSAIDAEYNAPTRLAERQMMLQGQDGGLFPAGTVNTGLSRFIVPGVIVLAAVAVLVVVLKK